MKNVVRQVTTEHDVSESSLKLALLSHTNTLKNSGMLPASSDNKLELELVKIVDGILTIRTSRV